MAQVDYENKQRQQTLFTKQQEESQLKNQRKANAVAQLSEFKATRDKQIAISL